jgi:hypothetical protein
MKNVELENDNVDQQIDQFWKDFKLFPSKWENLIFKQFLPLVGVSIFPYFIMAVGVLIAYFYFGEDKEWVIEKLTDWQTIILVVGLLIIGPFYLRWQSKIPEIFQWLFTAQRISAGTSSKHDYLKFLTGYQNMVSEGFRRYSFSILFCILILIFNWVDPDFVDYIEDGDNMDAMISIIKRIFGLLFWGYLSGLAIWPVFATGNQISKLSKQFKINIQARHPDRCGGLKPLGDFCFSMTLPIVIIGIILFLLAFGEIVLLEVSIVGFNFSETGETTILFANILLILFFLPLTVIAFFIPLWNIHREMTNQKMKYEEEFSAEIMRLEEQLRSSIRKENGLEKAKIAKDKMEILQTLNPNVIGFPVWPFRYKRLFTLFSPQILGVVSTILGLL